MLETAVVIASDGQPLYWHLPAGRSAVALPDSRALWLALWTARERLGGVAHTHPGAGIPRPSLTDLDTFAACEAGLGRRLDWWIATADQLRCFRWRGPEPLDYGPVPLEDVAPPWLPRLRALSYEPPDTTLTNDLTTEEEQPCTATTTTSSPTRPS